VVDYAEYLSENTKATHAINSINQLLTNVEAIQRTDPSFHKIGLKFPAACKEWCPFIAICSQCINH